MSTALIALITLFAASNAAFVAASFFSASAFLSAAAWSSASSARRRSSSARCRGNDASLIWRPRERALTISAACATLARSAAARASIDAS